MVCRHPRHVTYIYICQAPTCHADLARQMTVMWMVIGSADFLPGYICHFHLQRQSVVLLTCTTFPPMVEGTKPANV